MFSPLTIKDKNIFVTKIEVLRPDVSDLGVALQADTSNCVNIGKIICKMREKVASTQEGKELGLKALDDHLHVFLRKTFDIGSRRSDEYIKIASHPTLSTLSVAPSSLIELARLSEADLKKLFSNNKPEKVEQMAFSQIKKLARDNNTNKRKRKKDTQSLADKVGNIFNFISLERKSSVSEQIKAIAEIEAWLKKKRDELRPQLAKESLVSPKKNKKSA